MRPPIHRARRCGTTAPDAETALAAGWEHLPPDWWVCPACDAREAAATDELMASLKATCPAFGGGR